MTKRPAERVILILMALFYATLIYHIYDNTQPPDFGDKEHLFDDIVGAALYADIIILMLLTCAMLFGIRNSGRVFILFNALYIYFGCYASYVIWSLSLVFGEPTFISHV
ncbi:MAG: hypothetical protein A2Z72_03130 [Omnitrophica bacterium RBG_13_46_9]|nr:MAG: hypothetical protein A2Z72_03130 [Omnitrophica bacterium RBG_13_46_9]